MKQAKHFFASSAAEWHVNTDIEVLIKDMRRQGLPFSLWYVPLDINADYEIERYSPRVEGAVFLTSIKP